MKSSKLSHCSTLLGTKKGHALSLLRKQKRYSKTATVTTTRLEIQCWVGKGCYSGGGKNVAGREVGQVP